MRTVILTAVILTMTLSLSAQTFYKPIKVDINSKVVPFNEWFTYDGEDKMYKGSLDHITEYVWILVYETEGADENDEVRDADRMYELDGFDEYMAQDWDLSDGTTMTVTYKNGYGVIIIK
jgi:hypothetical protein